MKFSVVISALFAGAFAVPTHNVKPRFVGEGAHTAEAGQHPYTASLQFKSGGIVFSHVCGAVVISPYWSLTAAQCRDSFDLTRYRLVAGILNLSEKNPDTQITEIEELILHPDYHGGQGKNDIALILHATPLKFTDAVSPAKLPASGDFDDNIAYISGWGSGNILKYAKQLLYDYNNCLNILTEITGQIGPFDETQSCSGGEVQVCNEDVGSPITQDGVVFAIHSWSPCQHVPAPAVLVKIGSHLDFIHKHVQNM